MTSTRDGGAVILEGHFACIELNESDQYCLDQNDEPEGAELNASRTAAGGVVTVRVGVQLPAVAVAQGSTQCTSARGETVPRPQEAPGPSMGLTFEVPDGATLPYALRRGRFGCSDCIATTLCCNPRGEVPLFFGGSCTYQTTTNGTIDGTVSELSPDGVVAHIEGQAYINQSDCSALECAAEIPQPLSFAFDIDVKF